MYPFIMVFLLQEIASQIVLPCPQSIAPSTSLGIFVGRCIVSGIGFGDMSCSGCCQEVTFNLGDSGKATFAIPTCHVPPLTITWNTLSNQSCENFYSVSYAWNNVTLWNRSDCYESLIKLPPFQLAQSGCGAGDSWKCTTYVTIGNSSKLQVNSILLLLIVLLSINI
jgi:hypothetical protein